MKVGEAESEKSERSSAPSSEQVRGINNEQASAREIRSLRKGGETQLCQMRAWQDRSLQPALVSASCFFAHSSSAD